uniref:Pre-glycoprotein polyprotein GP complex n=1 Tax=Whitewater Arroyo mammarenavirus (isolate Rat/United States/AV 9310135/1995) TaxID=3052331 RepID=Q8B118_WWAVU|nr:glycoprotein precursor [Mammarenavirus whitewaterense]
MGQLISFFGEIPSIIHEALNIALIAVSIISILKGVINIWGSGLLQFIVFLLLAGRSCSYKIGHHVELQHIILNASYITPYVPMPCMINDTHFLLRGPFEASWAIKLEITDVTTLVVDTDNVANPTNISKCFANNQDERLLGFTMEWFLSGLEHDHHFTPQIICGNVSKGEVNAQVNITMEDHCSQVFLKMRRIFGVFKNPCTSHGKQNVLISVSNWTNQCSGNHLSSMHLIVQNAYKQMIKSRTLKSFFAWSLSDATGTDMPGGYCLEKWMLISSELKCFGNTAIAKCNLDHSSEFCDMLKLFEFNRNAIKTLQNDSKHQLDMIITAVNSLISDNTLMKNRLKELINIPYCNYTKFWYVNHTGFNVHSLPRCWLTKNGSYLNVSDFRNQWLLESDHLISEILSREYEARQGKTPLGLVDVCFWSTLFYVSSIFLHLLRIPTHRHIIGEGCPKPHRLSSDSVCACGLFKQKGRPLRWARKV